MAEKIRASKIRRFGPLASAGNRNFSRSSLGLSAEKSTSPESSLTPEVQRSLLQVGMRIRKSVLNGYKKSLEGLEENIICGHTQSTCQYDKHAIDNRSMHAAVPVHGQPPRSSESGCTCLHGHVSRRKRSLDEDEASSSGLSTGIFNKLAAGTNNSAVASESLTPTRIFAVPKSRKPRSTDPEPMDIDISIYTDESGEFAEANFLVPD
jgi:Ribonucleotide reductase inhibitor